MVIYMLFLKEKNDSHLLYIGRHEGRSRQQWCFFKLQSGRSTLPWSAFTPHEGALLWIGLELIFGVR